MKEIKFRVWDKKESKMFLGGSFMDVSQTQGVDRWIFGMDIFNHPDDVELMQYTGLKDKNGKEIFEGDIVLNFADDEVFEVYYGGEDGYPAFELKGYDGDANGLMYYTQDSELEVIGNIYENKELLNES